MLYVKYINETFSELTNGKVYYLHNISPYGRLYSMPYGSLYSIELRNDKGILATYILRDRDFIDVTKEIMRNKTIDEIMA